MKNPRFDLSVKFMMLKDYAVMESVHMERPVSLVLQMPIAGMEPLQARVLIDFVLTDQLRLCV
ncbi:hypothetical protein GF407_11415 [candidate division KSB1 bacterium]|nr:hypothetical protein [candidate division KSB1 bacterium]